VHPRATVSLWRRLPAATTTQTPGDRGDVSRRPSPGRLALEATVSSSHNSGHVSRKKRMNSGAFHDCTRTSNPRHDSHRSRQHIRGKTERKSCHASHRPASHKPCHASHRSWQHIRDTFRIVRKVPLAGLRIEAYNRLGICADVSFGTTKLRVTRSESLIVCIGFLH
jgi:hypothetical protein